MTSLATTRVIRLLFLELSLHLSWFSRDMASLYYICSCIIRLDITNFTGSLSCVILSSGCFSCVRLLTVGRALPGPFGCRASVFELCMQDIFHARALGLKARPSVCSTMGCIQDTLSSRAALGL